MIPKIDFVGVLLFMLNAGFWTPANAMLEVEDDIVDKMNVSRLLDDFMVGYDKRLRPNYQGEPISLGISLYILSISELSEKDMDFSFDMYFRQFWNDPRLVFEAKGWVNKLIISGEDKFVESIWVPDTFFVNEKSSKVHQAMTKNQFLRIMHDGEVLKSTRMTVKATCPMNLANFPMDIQMCSLEIESFGYTMSDLRFKWQDGDNSVQLSPDVALPQFNVLGHRTRLVEASLSSGNYSRLLVDVVFERALGYYLIQVYIPSSLIVVISWVSFWLNKEAGTARMGLGITTILSLALLFANVNASLPKISYVTSIDVYIGFCFVMVFGALIEYVCVAGCATKSSPQNMDGKRSFLDVICRFIFPIIFIIFHIVYWNVYDTAESVEDIIPLY